MNCISFPNMFNGAATNSYTGDVATKECLYLFLNSESGEMFGDPEFGVKIKRFFYNQNNSILKDIIIDELFTKINMFCPQISVNRHDILLYQYGKDIIGSITYMNKKDFTTDTYNILLFRGDE